jgi:hypothetical protein
MVRTVCLCLNGSIKANCHVDLYNSMPVPAILSLPQSSVLNGTGHPWEAHPSLTSSQHFVVFLLYN